MKYVTTIDRSPDRPSPTSIAAKTIALPLTRSPFPQSDRITPNPIAFAITHNPFAALDDRIAERTIGFAAFVGGFCQSSPSCVGLHQQEYWKSDRKDL